MTAEKSWIQTWSGKKFDLTNPTTESIEIEDIAHALSNLCRFNGHCSRFYSVAEHSLYVSYLVPPEHALAGLMHDATEAYISDIPRPLKRLLGPQIKELEQSVWETINRKFNIGCIELPHEVHVADNRLLVTEKKAFMDWAAQYHWELLDDYQAYTREDNFWIIDSLNGKFEHDVRNFRGRFLHRFHELTLGKYRRAGNDL